MRQFGKLSGRIIELSVSGMTDAQRNAWWADPDCIIGSIVKVDAMRYSAYGSLREPRFKEVRTDKDKPDL
jgi:DNA ligase-1